MCDPVSAAVVGGAMLGTSVYKADQQRKAVHAQQDALKAAQQADAAQAAQAETSAQVSANADLAASKQRRRASALALGGTDYTGSPQGSALGGGALGQPQAKTSVLGGGAA